MISQAKQINPGIRPVAIITKLDEFRTYPDCPIVIAEKDILRDPNTFTLTSMAMISNTSYRSHSINERLKQLEQSTPDSFYGTMVLTPREHQLLEAYALGMSNQETAEKLGLSVHSVRTYSSILLNKLGTSNRQKALRRVLSLGLAELVHLFKSGVH